MSVVAYAEGSRRQGMSCIKYSSQPHSMYRLRLEPQLTVRFGNSDRHPPSHVLEGLGLTTDNGRAAASFDSERATVEGHLNEVLP